MKHLIAVFTLLTLSACATDGARTTTGQNIGKSNWRPITIEESKLKAPKSIADEIGSIQMNSLPARRQEFFRFTSGGDALFEWTYDGGFVYPPSDNEFRIFFEGKMIWGQPILHEELVVEKSRGIRFSQIKRGKLNCIAFMNGLGEDEEVIGGIAKPAYLRGTICSKKDKEEFNNQMLADLEAVKFER